MATILIVEDEAPNRRALSVALQLEGYRTLEADGGPQALALLEKELPDLILLDLMMPEMNGYDVARLLRNNERTRDLPILVVSALALTWDIERAARAGLDDFLTKPFEPEELFARIEAALAARSASSD